MRKIISILITVLLLVQGFSAINVCAEEFIFSDPATEQFLNTLKGLELFSLYEDERMFFNDADPVLRSEAAQAIAGLLCLSGVGDASRVSGVFLDVSEFHKAAADIDVMLSLGVMKGMNNGNFEPDSPIQVQQFAKAMVCALGWTWKAEMNGGYPAGYLTTAYSMGLLKGINATADSALTRAQLVRILYNSLDIPVYVSEGQSGTSTTLKTNEDINILNQYCDIYKEKAVVNSNALSSLKAGFAPKSNKVLIGNLTLDVNGRTQIWNYFGYEVEFYYRQSADENAKLLYFTPTTRNEIINISGSQFGSYSGGRLYYNADKNTQLSIGISDKAEIILNGVLLQRDIERELAKGTGRMLLISNDGDSEADLIVIERSIYDKVQYVDADSQVVYCVDGKLDIANADAVSLSDENGFNVTIGELQKDDILEIISDDSAKFMRIYVLRNLKRALVKEMGANERYIVTDEGEKLVVADGTDMANVQVGTSYTIYINRFGEVVWFAELKQSGYQLGYLIKVKDRTKALSTEAACTILQDNGETAVFMIPEKMIINGESCKRENVKDTLAAIKRGLNLASDGETSQVIYYVTEGETILEITTAEAGNEDKNIILKCNPEGKDLFYRNTGYLTGILDGKYGLASITKVFKVPILQQEELDDDYYSVTVYNNSTLTDGVNYDIETYVSDKNELAPFAAVWYTVSSGIDISETANFCLVESVNTVLNSDGDMIMCLTGCYRKAKTTFSAKTGVDLSGINKGDIVVFSLDSGNKIQAIKKAYDYATKTVLPEFAGKPRLDRRCVQHVKVYNAPADSDFIQFVPIDFVGTEPDPEDILIVSLAAVKGGGGNAISSCTKNTLFEAKMPGYIPSYITDPEGCATAIVRSSLGYTNDIIFYME